MDVIIIIFFFQQLVSSIYFEIKLLQVFTAILDEGSVRKRAFLSHTTMISQKQQAQLNINLHVIDKRISLKSVVKLKNDRAKRLKFHR